MQTSAIPPLSSVAAVSVSVYLTLVHQKEWEIRGKEVVRQTLNIDKENISRMNPVSSLSVLFHFYRI